MYVMRATPGRRRSALSLNMTPMIDVVFLLIIFFLVSSNMARNESRMTIALPDALSGSRETADEGLRRIVINVPEPGSMLLGTRPIKPEDLPDILEYERTRSERPLSLIIRTQRSVPTGEIKPILVAAARAGVWDVSFAVVRRWE